MCVPSDVAVLSNSQTGANMDAHCSISYNCKK